MKCLVFDVWGDFAHFRKFYTTSSPLTFAIPPRTAIAGMISAIVGIDKEEYLKYFPKNKSSIALRIMKPIKKTRISYNLIDTKNAKMMSIIQNRTQVTFEVVKDCGYRIYFSTKEIELYEKLKIFLNNDSCYYTPCLGLSEFLCKIKYIGEFDFEEISSSNYEHIDSIVPFNDNTEIEFEEGNEYFKDTLPNEMNTDREVTEYLKVIYERNCRPIKCKINKFYKSSEDERIVFL